MTTTTGPDATVETTWLELPDAPAIPGLRFRRPRRDLADYTAAAGVMGDAAQADGVPWSPMPAHLRDEWERSTTQDMDHDIVLAEVDGTVIAVASIDRVVREGVIVYDLQGHVHPAFRRRGLGRALFAQNRRRATERAASDPPGEPQALGGFVELSEAAHVALLESAGMAPARWFQLMRRDLATPIPEAPLPPGLEIRPLRPEHHRAVFDAEVEAFRDHWGHHEPAPEDFELTYGREEFDPSLWVIAWDGDEVAAVVQNWVWPEENRRLGVERGWLEHISVRRPWRRRGLARAITAESLRRFAALGFQDGMLGVDADNPHGALGLYVGLGFEIFTRAAAYRGPLVRP